MIQFSFLVVLYFVVIAAAVVVLFWLAITAIRALNVYIRKNRLPSIDQH
ncbi:hypothetical protein [Frigoribacterium sp. UYMn621]|jgi:hypothetical protein